MVEDGDAKLVSDGTRAGSTLTTGRALKNLLQYTERSLTELLPMFTENPARLVGVYGRVGSIEPNKDADLVFLNEDCDVVRTFVKGVQCYVREA